MSPDEINIRILREDALEFVDEIVIAAGWNQLPADWLRVLSYEPDGCFAAYSADRLVGTVTTTTYGTDLAWIGMMLVHPDFRRRGIGTLLMQQSLNYLRDRRVDCIKLDATPEGRLVYEQLGFLSEWNFHRWERPASEQVPPLSPNQSVRKCDTLDRTAFGADRSAWLNMLAAHSFTIATDEGFGMIRSGRRATYLGPVTARTSDIAESIIRELLENVSGPVFWDIPGPNSAAQQIAAALGFRPVRELTRMLIGEMSTQPTIELQFALTGPETG